MNMNRPDEEIVDEILTKLRRLANNAEKFFNSRSQYGLISDVVKGRDEFSKPLKWWLKELEMRRKEQEERELEDDERG